MKFILIAKTLDMVEKISSRIQMTNTLVDLFKNTPKEIVDKVVYFLQGKLWPEWKGLPELGLGEKLLIKAIAMSVGEKENKVIELYKMEGDLGKITEELKKRNKTSAAAGLMAFIGSGQKEGLSVEKVYDILSRIATAQGEGSRDLKLRLLSGLLREAEPIEARFIVRFVEGRHRIGVGDMTILDALAIAYAGGGTYRPIIERAYNLRADLGNIAKIVAEKGIEAIKEIKPSVGIPVKPMLAERHNDPLEILAKAGGKAIAEYKYDGERVQIHKKGENIWLFSRRLENITKMYPDVVEEVRKAVNANEAIVEGEIVAIDPETGDMRPFQILMTRKRKYEIQRAIKEVPVRVYLFDAIYCDGEDLTTKTLQERKKVLEKIITETEGIRLAEYRLVETPEDLEKFFLEAIEFGAEGIMIKAVHQKSIYQAGNRGWLWIKYKRDYKSEMTDTVDLVVVGAFKGRGKRGKKLSTLLMAALDKENGVYRTVCKVGTGFTDEELDRMQGLLEKYRIESKHPLVISDIEPDAWIEPVLVAEIMGAEITLSPLHTCARGAIKKDVGISIRFPRFIRWRDDKGPEDITTCKELVEMYYLQLRKLEEQQK